MDKDVEQKIRSLTDKIIKENFVDLDFTVACFVAMDVFVAIIREVGNLNADDGLDKSIEFLQEFKKERQKQNG